MVLGKTAIVRADDVFDVLVKVPIQGWAVGFEAQLDLRVSVFV